MGPRVVGPRHDAGAVPACPCTTGTRRTSAPPTVSAWSCTTRRAACAPTGAAGLGDPVTAPDVDDWPDVPQTIAPPPASPEVLVPGTAFGLEPHGFHADKHVEYLSDVREDLPLYRDAARRAPGLDPARRQLRPVVQRPSRPVDPRRVGRAALRGRRGRPGGRLPRPRHRGVGAQGPPLRPPRRPPHRRRPAGGQDRPHRHLPPQDPDVCVDFVRMRADCTDSGQPRPRLVWISLTDSLRLRA